MAWNYLKQKPVSTPDANKNNKPVKTSLNPQTGFYT